MTEVRRPASGGLLAVGETMAMLAPASGGRLADAELFRLDAGGTDDRQGFAENAALGNGDDKRCDGAHNSLKSGKNIS